MSDTKTNSKISNTTKKVLFLSALVIVFIITALSINNQNEPKFQLSNPSLSQHNIILTKDGYVPDLLVIRQGDSVIFDTDMDDPYWPASSLHPEHLIYPEFDAKERIIPPENFEFTFDKPGNWTYHDHISPNYTGAIRVLSPEEEAGVATAVNINESDCNELEGYAKSQCWDEKLTYVLNNQGMAAAFSFFTELYNTEPDVPKACHEWGHALGEAGYKLYKSGQPLELRPEASYCGYGYFHSFIAEMFKDTGDMQGILEFCKIVEEELEDELPNIHDNCVHGVGHGTTAWLLEQPENWGDFMKTAQDGTGICELLYTSKNDLDNCYDGVYNELHLDLFNNQYGMNFAEFSEHKDPFYYCQLQEDRHKEACYFEFVGIFWSIFDLDIEKAMAYVIDNVHDLEQRGPRVVKKIAADWIQFDIVNENFDSNIQACRNVPHFLLESCLGGIANGFIQHGNPKRMHDKGFYFCNIEKLTDEERGICFDTVLGGLRAVYTPEKFRAACEELPKDKYTQNQCWSDDQQ